MKRKIGIGLLIILNLIFLSAIISTALVNYGIIVQAHGEVKGLILANKVTIEVIIIVLFLSAISVILNMF